MEFLVLKRNKNHMIFILEFGNTCEWIVDKLSIIFNCFDQFKSSSAYLFLQNCTKWTKKIDVKKKFHDKLIILMKVKYITLEDGISSMLMFNWANI
jgi:hypothetical protein